MEKRKVVVLFLLFASFIWQPLNAQFSVGGGLSSFHGLNIDVNRFGLNVFVESPRTTNNTLMVRASIMLPDKNTKTSEVEKIDPNDFSIPTKVEAEAVSKTSYFAVDGGTRFYLINDYDIGFAVYGGGHLKGILSSYSATYRLPDSLDANDYNTQTQDKSFSLLFGFGGNIGVKYQLPLRGALLFDFGAEIITGLYDPNLILTNEISPLSFFFNLSYRFDWY